MEGLLRTRRRYEKPYRGLWQRKETSTFYFEGKRNRKIDVKERLPVKEIRGWEWKVNDDVPIATHQGDKLASKGRLVRWVAKGQEEKLPFRKKTSGGGGRERKINWETVKQVSQKRMGRKGNRQ